MGAKITIHHTPGCMHRTVDQMRDYLAEVAQEAGIYQFAGTLVEVAASQDDTESAGVRRAKGAYVSCPGRFTTRLTKRCGCDDCQFFSAWTGAI